MSTDSLVEAVWDDVPPRTARKNIQVYVSALRTLVSQGTGPRISFRAGGYVFHAHPAELDWLCFQEQARARHRLRHDGPPALAAQALAGALERWRGRALDGLRDVPAIDAAAQRLERQFLAVFEDWAEAEIEAGSAASAIERITEVAGEHPLRERLRTLQMSALCQAGRRSEALAVYDDLRQSLAHELGLSPSPAVVRYYQSLLSEREPAGPGTAADPPRRRAPQSLLPWDPPAFTGRERCTQDLTEALVSGGNRLVMVTGPLGVGKTALAVHAAHRLGEDFPGGRFLVRLRDDDGVPRPLEEVVSQLSWAVAPETRPTSLPEARRAWQHWLACHRALVILDDARNESEVRPLLPEAGDSAVIVTARSRLGGLDGACRLSLPPLGLDEAVQLLERVIGARRVAADRRSAERIAAAAGLLPLGLRFVGERLALLHHLPLREYAARMGCASALLDELSAGDAAIRRRLAQAIGDVPEPARQAVPRLGTLPEPIFTLSEAASALGADDDTAMRLLEVLLEASIITVPDVETLSHSVLYELPVLPYAYAREMAAEPVPSQP